MEGIELFVELLFDKELQKQFFKECEELGVELDSLDDGYWANPLTDCKTEQTEREGE